MEINFTGITKEPQNELFVNVNGCGDIRERRGNKDKTLCDFLVELENTKRKVAKALGCKD